MGNVTTLCCAYYVTNVLNYEKWLNSERLRIGSNQRIVFIFNIVLDTLVYGRLCNRAGHIYFHPVVSSFFFSSPKLSGRRLDVYHTSTNVEVN